MSESDPFPCIDLQKLNPEEIGKVCNEWGMFRLINHGIPVELTAQLEEQSKKLFFLPFDSKQEKLQTPMSYFWDTPALTPNGVAVTKGIQKVNRVEGIYTILNEIPQMPGDDPMVKSVSIHHRSLLEEYGKHMYRLARCLFEALRENVGIDPALSDPYLSISSGFIRTYRYLQCSEPDKEGLGVHTDSSVLSILHQDEVGGLQVLKEDRWMEIKPITNSLIVNIGDMFQAMSNDEYKSAEHRVINKGNERISICYFVFPDDDGIIHSTKYKPFTYKNFQGQVQEDLKTIGVKVGLERFKST